MTRDAAELTENGDRSFRFDLALMMIVGVAAGIITWWATPSGLLQVTDTMSYFSTALNVADGKGVTTAFAAPWSQPSIAEQLAHLGRVPLEEWPPGYPLLLSVGIFTGLTVEMSARWLSVAGAVGFGIGFVWIARRELRLPMWWTTVLAVVAIVAPSPLIVDLGPMGGRLVALSESVFIPLSVIAVAVGLAAVRRPTAWLSCGAGIAVAVATLVRPTGAVLGVAIGWGVYSALSERDQPLRRKALTTALAAMSGPVVLVLWGVVNRLMWHASGSSGRSAGWYVSASPVSETVRGMSGWFGVSADVPLVVASLVTIVSVMIPIVVVMVPRSRGWIFERRKSAERPATVLALVVVGSWLAVVATQFFLNSQTSLSVRHLASLQPFVYLLDGLLVWLLVERWLARSETAHTRSIRVVSLGMFSVLGGLVIALPTARTVQDLRRDLSHVLATAPAPVASNVAKGSLVVSNDPAAVWGWSRRPVLLLPVDRFTTSDRANPQYASGLDRMVDLSRDMPTIVVVYPAPANSADHAVRYLSRHAHFVELGRCRGAVLWGGRTPENVETIEQLCSGGQ